VRAKSVLGAIIPTFLVMGVLVTVLMGCGSYMAYNIPFLGPAINAVSPTSGVLMMMSPWEKAAGALENPGMTRGYLIVWALVAGGVYAGMVWSLLSTVVSGFDFTVRKLSGRGA
jgi:hypothetical protein